MNTAYRNLPNQLTMLRLVFTAAFLLVLNQYRYEGPTGDPHTIILFSAIVLFILAALTDWADGYLARLWKVESTFGRIMDPFCDKVLILGSFIYLAGPRFVDVTAVANGEPILGIIKGNNVTGVYPWMVVVILARELLVTGIRGELEGMGIKFGANIWGKGKMVLQCVTVPAVLFIIWLDPVMHEWLGHTRTFLVYLTVLVTIMSGIPYITGARKAMKAAGDTPDTTSEAPNASDDDDDDGNGGDVNGGDDAEPPNTST